MFSNIFHTEVSRLIFFTFLTIPPLLSKDDCIYSAQSLYIWKAHARKSRIC